MNATLSLDTARLVLRPFSDDDRKDIYEYAKEPIVGLNCGWKPYSSLEDANAFLENVRSSGDFVFSLQEKKTGKVIGSVGLHHDSRRPSMPFPYSSELGFALAKEYWGKGLMKEAATRVLSFGFDNLRIRIVSANHFTFNDRSRGLIKALGFRYEGTLKKAIRRFDGAILDLVCYALTREEWVAKEAEDD